MKLNLTKLLYVLVTLPPVYAIILIYTFFISSMKGKQIANRIDNMGPGQSNTIQNNVDTDIMLYLMVILIVFAISIVVCILLNRLKFILPLVSLSFFLSILSVLYSYSVDSGISSMNSFNMNSDQCYRDKQQLRLAEEFCNCDVCVDAAIAREHFPKSKVQDIQMYEPPPFPGGN